MMIELMHTPAVHKVAPETVKAATTIVAIMPILFTYPFLQKYFIKGIMIGALKG